MHLGASRLTYSRSRPPVESSKIFTLPLLLLSRTQQPSNLQMNSHEYFERGSLPSFNIDSPSAFNWNSLSPLIGSSPTAFSNALASQDTVLNNPSSEFTSSVPSTHVPREQSPGSMPVSTAALQTVDPGEGSSSTATQHIQPAEMNAPPKPTTLQRTKYRGLNWEAHKAQIKSLYLEGKRNLQETMEIMKDQHGFDAS